jgi:hypothetical protein
MASLIPGLGRVFPPIARYILAAVFLFSAMGKLVSPAQFHAFVASFLPTLDTTVLLYSVVLVEIALAFLLVYPRTSVVGGGMLGGRAARVYSPPDVSIPYGVGNSVRMFW